MAPVEAMPPGRGRGPRKPQGPGREAPPPPRSPDGPLVGNARLAFVMFLGAESMFFAGLVGAFLVFRIAAEAWPPPFQPRLPVLVTAFNTALLLVSGATMRLGLSAVRNNHLGQARRWLGATLVLGCIFLFVQGYEWTRLIQFGLTLQSGVYGATFYVLIGCHALHVLGGVVWVGLVLTGAWRGRYTAGSTSAVELCAMYWTFVVALWPLLYGLVYLY